jgi:hypothetical protein
MQLVFHGPRKRTLLKPMMSTCSNTKLLLQGLVLPIICITSY